MKAVCSRRFEHSGSAVVNTSKAGGSPSVIIKIKLLGSTTSTNLVSNPDVLSSSIFGHIPDLSQLNIFSWPIWTRQDAKFVPRKYAPHKGICLI